MARFIQSAPGFNSSMSYASIAGQSQFYNGINNNHAVPCNSYNHYNKNKYTSNTPHGSKLL